MRDETEEALDFVSQASKQYLGELNRQPVRPPNVDEAAWSFASEFPEGGAGALPTLAILVEKGIAAAVRSAGPRFFHFVQGGRTPAALAADWLTSVLDQNSLLVDRVDL